MWFRWTSELRLMAAAVGLVVMFRVGCSADAGTDYKAAFERLSKQFIFERVAKERIEVDWADLRGMATPISSRILIQPCHNPNIIFVHPDMSIALGTQKDSLCLGFAFGPKLDLPDMWQVTRNLYKGYQPCVESKRRVEDVVIGAGTGVWPENRASLSGSVQGCSTE